VKSERIALILPNRVGDAILALPLVLCLRDLVERSGTGDKVEAFTAAPVIELFRSVGVAGVYPFDLAAKLKSWVSPPDKAFFLTASSKNFGFRSRDSYGLNQKNKPLVRYTHDLDFLRGTPIDPDLAAYLSGECRLPAYAIEMFGIMEHLGFGVKDVKAAFSFSRERLPIARSGFDAASGIVGPYLVCCMEAAYGKVRNNADRRWDAENYLKLAAWVVENYGCSVVFIGLDPEPQVPDNERFIDMRGKLTLFRLFQLMTGAAGYLGNDTGPLHLANLAGIPTVGVYSRDDYHAPLFGELNSVFLRPSGCEELQPALDRMLAGAKIGKQP
jgi:hypothetical protein